MALSVPLSRFTSRVGGGSAFFVRRMKPLLKSVPLVRGAKWAALILLSAYVGIYAILSAQGHYVPNMSWGGLSDVYEFWQPKALFINRPPVTGYDESGHRVYFYGNTAGYFFMPLVFIDRAVVHRARALPQNE